MVHIAHQLYEMRDWTRMRRSIALGTMGIVRERLYLGFMSQRQRAADYPILGMVDTVWGGDFAFSPRAVADAKARIAEALAPYDAVQTLAALLVTSMFTSGKSYSEARSIPSSALEYITVVLLERPDPSGLRVMTGPQTQRAAHALQIALDNARLIGLQTTFAKLRKAEVAADPLESLGALVYLYDSTVRGPGYAHQATAVLGLAMADTDVARHLFVTLGFDHADAIALDAALGDLMLRRYNAAGELFTDLTTDPEEFASQMYRRAEHIIRVTPEELAAEASRDPAVAEAFLLRLSMRFGSVRGTHLISDVRTIRDRPFVELTDGRFLVTSAVNPLWALRPLFEEALADSDVWETYQASRARMLEQTTVDVLAQAIQADVSQGNVYFSVDGGPLHEIDGIVVLDDTCFVIEAKSARLNRDARRGRRREVRAWLENLVGTASTQVLRLADAIRDQREIEFFADRARTPTHVGLGNVTRVEPIIVTLDDVTWLVGREDALHDLGIVDPSASVPWVVSVYDFEVICRTLEFPAQLVGYLEQRRSAMPIGAGDELNVWAIYLLESLSFPSDGRVMLQGDWTKEIDRYFMFDIGKPPRMPLAPQTRRAVMTLNRARASGHLQKTLRLITDDQASRTPVPGVTLTDGTERKLYVYANVAERDRDS